MKVTIYWATKDGGLIDRIRKRFGISAGITVNGETVAEVDDGQLDELRDYESKRYIGIQAKADSLQVTSDMWRNVAKGGNND